MSQLLCEVSTYLVSSLKDAETGQRGFLLTYRDLYLEPYNRAVTDVPRILTTLESLTEGQPDDARRVQTLKLLVRENRTNSSTIDVRRAQGADAAMAMVLSDRGKLVMDQLRLVSGGIEIAARSRLAHQTAAARSAASRSRLIIFAGSMLIFGLLISATIAVQRGTRRRLALIEELRASQAANALLASIVESSDDAIISETSEGIITSWNTGAENLFGYSAAEMVGSTTSRLVPPDAADNQPALLARIRRNEPIHHYETVRVRRMEAAFTSP